LGTVISYPYFIQISWLDTTRTQNGIISKEFYLGLVVAKTAGKRFVLSIINGPAVYQPARCGNFEKWLFRSSSALLIYREKR